MGRSLRYKEEVEGGEGVETSLLAQAELVHTNTFTPSSAVVLQSLLVDWIVFSFFYCSVAEDAHATPPPPSLLAAGWLGFQFCSVAHASTSLRKCSQCLGLHERLAPFQS